MRRHSRLLLLVCLLLTTGCRRGSPPVPVDPATARAALDEALSSWKKGEGFEPLARRTPPLRVLDREWRAGERLLDYQLTDDETVGAELRCRVRLSLQGHDGSPIEKEAVYSIGTGPALTISREDVP